MGTDLDLNLYLRKNKISTSQFQQPPHQLDGVTESTQQPNVQFLIQLINIIQRRLGNRLNNSQNPIAVMVQLSDNQRIIIALPGPETNVNQTQNQNDPREGALARMMRHMIDAENQDRQMSQLRDQQQEVRPIRRQMPRLQQPRQFPQINQRLIRMRSNLQQIQENEREQQRRSLHMQQNENQDFGNLNERQENMVRQSHSMRQISYTNNQQSIIHQNEDLHFQRRQQNQQGVIHQQINRVGQNQSVNDLNQISKKFQLNPNNREQVQDNEVSCWQGFKRMIGNLFRRDG